MNPNYIYAVAVIFALVGIAGFSVAKGKKVVGVNKNLFGAIFLILSVFVFALQMGYLTQFSPALSPLGVVYVQGTGVAETGNTGGAIETCDQSAKVTVTLSAVDKYLSTATGGSHRYSINGNPAIVIADQGTFTAGTKDKIEVMFGNESKTGYFAQKQEFELDCRGAQTLSAKMVQNGSLTATFFNSPNNQPIDGGAVNQSLSANDVGRNVKLILQGASQKEFPNGFVVVLEMNKTTIKDVVMEASGVELASASIPSTFSPTLGTDSKTKAYIVPATTGSVEYVYNNVIDAQAIEPAVAGSDILYKFFPQTLYIDGKDGDKIKGPSAEDEYNAVTRTGQVSATLEVM